MNQADTASALLILLTIVFVYFAPSLVAIAKVHHNSNGIIILNLFLGWTLIGWVAALIWSFTSPSQTVVVYRESATKPEPPVSTSTMFVRFDPLTGERLSLEDFAKKYPNAP